MGFCPPGRMKISFNRRGAEHAKKNREPLRPWRLGGDIYFRERNYMLDRRIIAAVSMVLLVGSFACSQTNPPKPFGPIPSPQQLAWHELEYYAFVHFNMNTFTGNEWGTGKEDPKLFNPTELDCDQWARVFKEAGMKGVIITAKHHDGFCLWPSRYTEHSVKNSPWRNGEGDVLKELSEACKKYGLKFGLYLSPWDRHEPTYGDSPGQTHFK